MGAPGADSVDASERFDSGRRTAVLFVCTGNICRSPLAEGVFRALVASAGLQHRIAVDSAGTHDSQVGQLPDPRTIAVARRHGYDLSPHYAREVGTADYSRFDWIMAMDQYNLEFLQALRPITYRGHLGLMPAMGRESGVIEVPDPYFGGPREFEHVFELVERGAGLLLATIRERLSISVAT
jgi:protein-tyrosine phosphatase